MAFLKNVATAVTVGTISINPFPTNRKEDGKQRKQSNYSLCPCPTAGGDNNKKLASSWLTTGTIIFKQRTKLVALLTQVSTVKEPGRKINKQASKQTNCTQREAPNLL